MQLSTRYVKKKKGRSLAPLVKARGFGMTPQGYCHPEVKLHHCQKKQARIPGLVVPSFRSP